LETSQTLSLKQVLLGSSPYIFWGFLFKKDLLLVRNSGLVRNSTWRHGDPSVKGLKGQGHNTLGMWDVTQPENETEKEMMGENTNEHEQVLKK